MSEAEFENRLKRLFNHDFSEGSETFRDSLLARCIEELDADSEDGERDLEDSELENLAAAGDLSQIDENGLSDQRPRLC